MSTRFTRPAGTYDSTSVTTNMTKYRADSAATPKVAISSAKMDGDFNTVIDALNALDDDINGLVAGSVPDGSITAAKLASDAVTTAKILDANVTTAKIAPLAVDATLLASNAVTTAKILDANVTEGKLANAAVTANKLAADAVTEVKLASDSVTTAKILNSNVTYAKIQNVSAASRLLGRGSASGAGAVEELTLDSTLALSGTALGAFLPAEFIGTSVISSATDSVHTVTVDTSYQGSVFVLNQVLPATNATDLLLTVSTNGGSSYIAGTAYTYTHSAIGPGAFTAPSSTGTSSLALTATAPTSNSGVGISGFIYVTQIGTGRVLVNGVLSYGSSTPNFRQMTISAVIDTSSASINRVKFAFSSGNITSGTITQHRLRRA